MSNEKMESWSPLKKACWRFLFLYVLLYIYPYGFEYVQELTTSDISFWPSITSWFAELFLGWKIDKDNLLNGFDSKYDYSRFLLVACLSVIGTLVWLWIDKRLNWDYNRNLKIALWLIEKRSLRSPKSTELFQKQTLNKSLFLNVRKKSIPGKIHSLRSHFSYKIDIHFLKSVHLKLPPCINS